MAEQYELVEVVADVGSGAEKRAEHVVVEQAVAVEPADLAFVVGLVDWVVREEDWIEEDLERVVEAGMERVEEHCSVRRWNDVLAGWESGKGEGSVESCRLRFDASQFDPIRELGRLSGELSCTRRSTILSTRRSTRLDSSTPLFSFPLALAFDLPTRIRTTSPISWQ